jgi:type II secretion system protein J
MIKNKNGFMLVELIIGITILSLIITAVYSAFNISFKTYKKIEEQNNKNQNLRRAISFLTHSLRSAFYIDDKKLAFIGEDNLEMDKITFVAYMSNIYSKDSGLVKLKYYIDDDPLTDYEGLICEYYKLPLNPENINPDKIIEISPLVKSLNLRYYDGKEWQNTWGKNFLQNKLPLDVEITITLEKKDNQDAQNNFSTIAHIYASE